MLIKVCGMRDSANILQVEKLGVDMMGFIFYSKSPRYVDSLPDYMPCRTSRVGVFVDEDMDKAVAIAKEFALNFMQLHGRESVAYCQELRAKGYSIIKAFSIATVDDLLLVEQYSDVCDMFIFDSKTLSIGGSGESFDWSLLGHYKGSTPFLLSGGLGVHNSDLIANFNHPSLIGYDLNSAFETLPGVKDIDKLVEFLKKIGCNE